ncbi:hypothetical protein GCM10007415_42070 [Parapedobacter pyrenivorans]|uniref:Uncharacterized protein n=1 Tax=Parapedobacter pyrenivorans TaxID=1305674 RepID=A0A917I0J0_9SPHI|nr:hypothetical protein [Parapedobacter pyrenivorans]GGH01522.1 hypothetical protein GCM10007415_42070 [Parapedobacter pyrenivorans]
MNSAVIDLELIDEGNGKNPFEDLMAQVENLSLQGKLDVNKNELEKTILFLERKYQDLSDIDYLKSKILLQAFKANVIISEHNEDKSFIRISDNLTQLKDLSVALTNNDITDLHKYILSDNTELNDKLEGEITVDLLQTVYDKVFRSGESKRRKKEEWIIEMNFDVPTNERHLPLEFLHTFIQGLNTVHGLSVTLEDIHIGSIKARIKVVFDDIGSKEEAMELLESARQLAMGKIEEDRSGIEKIESEQVDNKRGTLTSKEHENGLTAEDLKEVKKLEVESLRYDIERKRLENEEKRLILFKKRKEVLKELLAEGIIGQRQMEMLIKGLPFLKIEDGRLTIGENIDIINDL